ncbi:MAG: hypothetical protein QOJ71_268, partial [Actinomycetota bacterium]|nr:hypothetical protein [Actinomycetota bacterium]
MLRARSAKDSAREDDDGRAEFPAVVVNAHRLMLLGASSKSCCGRQAPNGRNGASGRSVCKSQLVLRGDDPVDRVGRLANLARWDEAAPLHAQSALYDLESFRAGRDDIRPFEHDELGSVEGRDLLHLQCHIGTDTLSWARHGARVSGLDFSPNAIDIARTLAAECAIDAKFWCADVYDALEAV